MTKTLKIGIFLIVLVCLTLLVVTLVDLPLGQKAPGLSVSEENVLTTAELDAPDLLTAVENALASASERWQIFNYQIDHIQVQDDGQMAIIWLAAIDPETGDVIAREPELALAELGSGGQWQVQLEDEDKFSEAFAKFQFAEKSVQGDLLSDDQALPKSGAVFGGYYLPWPANLEKRLTWSVAHTSCYPTYYCTHAFDFADGTMFPLVAAKGGTVFHWKDTCANGDSYCTNSITLQDRSTTPWTYQIYLHIAQGSVPSNLKSVGTTVLKGQLIANVDDTGYSSGHHVHFMVVSENTRYMSPGMGSVWGVAEDITFRDVSINWDAATRGGRPRLQYEADIYGGEGQTYYVSGNRTSDPPTGGLTAPADKSYFKTPRMTVSAWGRDDVAVQKMAVMAEINGVWQQIGKDLPGDSFNGYINLCNTNVPDGPFKLGLRVWDIEGNPSPILSVRRLIKNVECVSGVDPDLRLVKKDGTLALPQIGFVSATVTKGSTGASIQQVEFYFHDRIWEGNDWVYLGKDTNGTNGWQAPILLGRRPEGDDYIVLAVATDSAGNQDAALTLNAIVDRTPPWLRLNSVPSPVSGSFLTLSWRAGDALAGLDRYVLKVNVNYSGYQTVSTTIPGSARSYSLPISKAQVLVLELTAYDKSGNKTTRKTVMYTDGYVLDYDYLFPMFSFGE